MDQPQGDIPGSLEQEPKSLRKVVVAPFWGTSQVHSPVPWGRTYRNFTQIHCLFNLSPTGHLACPCGF